MARATSYLLMLATARNVWAPPDARASWVESFVMPGEVAEKHARFETECTKCHAPFDKAAQDRLCLNCHSGVAADLRSRRGYHGRAPAVSNTSCKTCHGEHRGRGADIVQLDRRAFDHRLTDQPLRGAHAGLACGRCHAAGKHYRDVSRHCSDCHARTDPHQRSLGAACDRCHEESAWKTVRFDHDATAFPLRGRHRGARCDGCHTTKRYKPTATACSACHARDDKHHGGLGGACASCHTPQAWSGVRFDHARKTQFALLGSHERTACERCHRPDVAPAHTPIACAGCHQKDDAHRGRFGGRCETCHTPIEWRGATFDHGRATGFALRGRHRDVRCTDCHHGAVHAERLTRACYGCHREDDVHRGRQGAGCDSCHDERGWSRDVLFDHDSSRFPLVGAHARVACAACHISAPFRKVARECVACHQRADVHRNRLGSRCGDCHSAVAWRLVRTPR